MSELREIRKLYPLVIGLLIVNVGVVFPIGIWGGVNVTTINTLLIQLVLLVFSIMTIVISIVAGYRFRKLADTVSTNGLQSFLRTVGDNN